MRKQHFNSPKIENCIQNSEKYALTTALHELHTTLVTDDQTVSLPFQNIPALSFLRPAHCSCCPLHLSALPHSPSPYILIKILFCSSKNNSYIHENLQAFTFLDKEFKRVLNKSFCPHLILSQIPVSWLTVVDTITCVIPAFSTVSSTALHRADAE
jgi:hypothetical protein